jgi:hypothetical protein
VPYVEATPRRWAGQLQHRVTAGGLVNPSVSCCMRTALPYDSRRLQVYEHRPAKAGRTHGCTAGHLPGQWQI